VPGSKRLSRTPTSVDAAVGARWLMMERRAVHVAVALAQLSPTKYPLFSSGNVVHPPGPPEATSEGSRWSLLNCLWVLSLVSTAVMVVGMSVPAVFPKCPVVDVGGVSRPSACVEVGACKGKGHERAHTENTSERLTVANEHAAELYSIAHAWGTAASTPAKSSAIQFIGGEWRWLWAEGGNTKRTLPMARSSAMISGVCSFVSHPMLSLSSCTCAYKKSGSEQSK
jgi:hypothetical protein